VRQGCGYVARGGQKEKAIFKNILASINKKPGPGSLLLKASTDFIIINEDIIIISIEIKISVMSFLVFLDILSVKFLAISY
jgi:hypothetical protein